MVLVGWQQAPGPVTKSMVLRDSAGKSMGWRGEQRQRTQQSWDALGDPPFGFLEAHFPHVAETSLKHMV